MDVTLFEHEVELAHALEAGFERHERRTRLYLELSDDGGVGVGEIAPQREALNGDPGVDDVRRELLDLVLPQVLAIRVREGEMPSWSRIARLRGPRRASASALALVEMALLDRELRQAHQRLDDWWPARAPLALQRGVSLLRHGDPWPELEGVVRLRAKVAPRRLDLDALARVAETSLPVILDFNASASTFDEVRDVWQRVSAHVVVEAVEQPFQVGNFVDSARLSQEIPVAVSLDEGLRSLSDLDQILRYGAASVLCVKPARVGGLSNARAIITRAREHGLRPYVGGFFESPYARQVYRILARHCVNEPSDVGDVATVDGLDEVQSSALGFGYRVDPRVLECSRVWTIPFSAST